MPRLPIPGSDDGHWGDLLNEFLSVELSSDGSLKKASQIQAAQTTANNAQTAANTAQSGLAGKADTSAIIPLSTIDAKGDLIAGTADNTAARLAVGNNGEVLTADSTRATGVKWASAGLAALSWTPLITTPNSGNFGGAYAPLGAAIDGFGVVHLRGLVSFSANISSGGTIATLPSPAYYPAHKKIFLALDAQSLGTYFVMLVNTDGTITSSYMAGTANIIAFDSITFELQS